jgi:heterotetrameric sarcosine oxidase gamma subunit
MPDAPAIRRRSPLEGVLHPGRHGAEREGGPGVRLALRHPLSILTVIARAGQTEALSAALRRHYGVTCPPPGHSASGGGLVMHWSGPEQWTVIAEGRNEGALYDEMKARVAGLASIFEQSHGRVVIAVAGPRARDVISKGTPVDLHPRAFGEGRCAVTQMAHVGVHVAQVGPDNFELSLFRGFAESFWEWLTEMAEEFGYEVA